MLVGVWEDLMEHDSGPEQNILLSSVESTVDEHNRVLSARLHALEKATSDLCWVTTHNGHFLAEQTSWENFTGQHSAQAAGKGWLETVHPSERRLLESIHSQCVQTGKSYYIVCLLQNARGHYMSLSIHCVPVFNEAGNVNEVMYLGTLLLPGQRSIDKWLHQIGMEHLEALLIDMAYDAIILTDHVGRILSWNQGATNLYGHSAEEVVGQRAFDVLQPDASLSKSGASHSLEEFVHSLLRDGKWEGELSHTRHDGRLIIVEAHFVLIRSENGHPLAVLDVSRDITERKHTEQLLKEYIQLAETAGEIGLWTWDFVQEKSFFSLPAKMISSVPSNCQPSQPVSYKQFLHMVHPDDRTFTDEALRTALEQKIDYINEFRTVDVKQNIFWYMAYGRMIFNEQGKPVRMIGILVNITERKRIEQALLEANEQVTSIIESVTDAFIYLDKEWRYIYANSHACNDLRKSRDELVGNVLWDVQPQLRGTIVEQRFRETMDKRNGTVFNFFCELTETWLVMRTYPAKDGITVFMADITERMHIEEALRKSEAKFRRLAEANVGGTLVGDAKGRILEANDAFLKMIGYTREELEHGEINWRALTPPEYHEADEHALQEARDTGVFQLFEKEFFTRQGKRVPILLTGTTLEEDAEKHIVFVVDLSKQKELEKQRERFLHLVSHELRTPLTAINGSLQLAQRRLLRAKQRTSLTPEFEAVLNKIEEVLLQSLHQTNVLNRLTDDLVESARITAEKLSLSLQPRNLVEIVQATVEDTRFAVPKRNIMLEDMPQKVWVLVDPDRISQVLSNFISNALKYSPHEKPVAVGVKLEGQERVRVWVRDWGEGLSPEDQQRIWQRYFQGKGVQDHDIKSVNLGLGLYLCTLLVQQHDGSVGVESQLGEGSTFWFTLPVYSEPDAKASSAAMARHG
jgi:PAS domain S-box-containing protein